MRARNRRGFTLMEIMVVVCILGLLATVTTLSLIERKNEADRRVTRLTISQVENALELYRLRHNHYPSASEGLDVLVSERFIKESARDAWGNPLRYELQGGEPVITSLGADNAQGGEGPNSDLSNRPSAPQVLAQRL